MDIIEVTDFSKSFEGTAVHKDINFVVKNGECLGLLGGSGAGKSVILRSLIGLEKPDTGVIRIENTNVTTMSETDLYEIRKSVAYVFQNGALFDSMTVFDNVAYSLTEHSNLNIDVIKMKVHEILSDFNLEGTEDLYPSELSGGMLKRVGLARAIVTHPKIVLYDEPTAGLDPANTVMIQELILKLKKQGATSILVTHDLDTALRVCDRICFLKEGHIYQLEPVEVLRKDRDRFMNMFAKGEL